MGSINIQKSSTNLVDIKRWNSFILTDNVQTYTGREDDFQKDDTLKVIWIKRAHSETDTSQISFTIKRPWVCDQRYFMSQHIFEFHFNNKMEKTTLVIPIQRKIDHYKVKFDKIM